MLIILIVLATAILAVAIIRGKRVPGGVNAGNLGWMSEQWLAEHRMSHSL